MSLYFSYILHLFSFSLADFLAINLKTTFWVNEEKILFGFFARIIDRFPFRINTIQTDNGHEFQAKFHWHVEDLGMRHRYIRAKTPQLNGKVERSYLTDKREFYQLL